MKRTVVITGATKGLGRSTALAFAQAGHCVVGLYSSDDNAAESLRRDLRFFGDDSLVVQHDVSRSDDEVWNHPQIQESRGLVLINNAWGPFSPQPLHLLRWEDFEAVLNLGLKGSWLCARALLRPMARSQQGLIVNVLSTVVQGLPPKGFAAYAAGKHALRGLTLALAVECKPKGVRAFSVSPGFMATSLTAGWDARLVELISAGNPAGNPEDAARRICELVIDDKTPGYGEDYTI